MRLNKTATKEILSELWEHALFTPEIYELVESISENPGKKTVSSEQLFQLSTIRNRNLITSEGQNKLKGAVVGFFGLSVGSHAVLTWMMESRADQVKIIDPETISPSNLNRLRFGWNSVGKDKVSEVLSQIKSIHPLAKVTATKKTDFKTTVSIFDNVPRLDILVEEIDNLADKVLLRRLAKQRKIPVVCVTDVGDNVFIDVERYDLEPNLDLFLGRVPGIESMDLKNLPPKARLQLAIRLVGLEHNSEEMLDSLLAIGKTLKTWPQLGATATIAGGVISTVIKKIVLGEKVKSGRYYLDLDELLVSDFNNEKSVLRRKNKAQEVVKLAE